MISKDFSVFSQAVHARYNDLARNELFVVDVLDIYATYLSAFPEGTNPIFRTNTEHDCNCCKQFIRRLGQLVAIAEDGSILTMWDNYVMLPEPYRTVSKVLADVVRQSPIQTVFRTKERQYGTASNRDTADPSIVWNHFHGRVADKHFAIDPATKRGERETIAQVLRRGLDELNPADIETVLDLIDAKAIYRGEEHRAAVVGFRDLQRAYRRAVNKDTFVWSNLDNRNARFRITVIGTLLVDLAEGTELERAVKKFEAKVAPENYKRPTALVTPKMIEQAVATLEQLGLEGAVQRRFARIEDVAVNDVLFVDNTVRGQMKGGLTDLLMEAVRPATPKLDHATPISIEDFIASVLPTATSIQALIRNKHVGNFVSLTGGDGPERLFKWNNNFAWSYDGEVTDTIEQRVKAAGGKTGAGVALRVSLAWSNSDDLDIHAVTPRREHIYYGNKAGVLDVDMNAGGPTNSTNPVENLSWNRLVDGVYTITVNQFSQRMTDRVGFVIEIDGGGRVEQFVHAAGLRRNDTSSPILITVKNGRIDKIEAGTGFVGGTMSVDKWGVKTETLVPVDTIMLSPNHWDGAGAIGNRHFFFMLKGCNNPDAVRGIYNEFLRGDLDKHRKVLEVLGAKTKCPPSDDQLSGVGFSSTRSDEVTVVVDGRRAYNIKF